MRIAVDARSFFMRTGIARYTRAMLSELTATDGPHEWLLLISDRHTADEVRLAGPRVRAQVSSAPWLVGARERRRLEVEATSWGADAFYSIFPPIALESVPSVVTIFDWIAWSHPQLLPPRVVRAFRAASVRALPRARSLVVISEATAAQLRQYVPDCAQDVVVASCGVSPELLRAPQGAPAGADRQGALFVGTIEPRKNVPLVVQAARELPGVSFTIVGKRGWGEYDLAGDIQDLPNVTWLAQVDDDQLAAAYARAAVFVYPSQVEGFGLPVLEALSFGALPIVSADPALGEIVTDRELVVDVTSPGALSHAIDRWLSHPDERARRVARLREQSARFTWTNGARAVQGAIVAAARGHGEENL
jgi:glycosyltransferase involved in cell wall biosynthesis